MEFGLSREHQLLRQMYRAFAETEIKPNAAEVDELERFPKENVEKMVKAGFMGIPIAKKYGGEGGDNLGYIMAVEELSRVCATTGVILSAHTSLGAGPIEKFGSEEQKQRLTIARAMLRKPAVLILDDSTSAVDTATDSKIREAFFNHLPDTTVIIIAQRISSIQGADNILVLDDGKVNGLGTHEELMETNDLYRDIYETQMKGAKGDE